MEIKIIQKYLRISPKKVRPVYQMVKKMSVANILETLPFINKRGSLPLLKVFKTAVADAKNRGISITDLLVKEVQINEGPRLKKGVPASRGRWHPIKKRMCHIRVVLSTKSVSNKKDEMVQKTVASSKLKAESREKKPAIRKVKTTTKIVRKEVAKTK